MLTRRTLLAVPALVALPKPSLAREPNQLTLTPTAWGMLEHRIVSEPKDTIFEKVTESPVTYISGCGRNVVTQQKPDHVVVPMWTETDHKGMLGRLESTLRFLVWDHIPVTVTADFKSQIGDADRVCRIPPDQLGPKRAPEIYVLSRGPVGYHLRDACNPDRHGVIVFRDRLRAVAVEGLPYG